MTTDSPIGYLMAAVAAVMFQHWFCGQSISHETVLGFTLSLSIMTPAYVGALLIQTYISPRVAGLLAGALLFTRYKVISLLEQLRRKEMRLLRFLSCSIVGFLLLGICLGICYFLPNLTAQLISGLVGLALWCLFNTIAVILLICEPYELRLGNKQ
ncbi:MAG: hypothetical protein AAGA35_04320 [Patescibacteria group bacterium]